MATTPGYGIGVGQAQVLAPGRAVRGQAPDILLHKQAQAQKAKQEEAKLSQKQKEDLTKRLDKIKVEGIDPTFRDAYINKVGDFKSWAYENIDDIISGGESYNEFETRFSELFSEGELGADLYKTHMESNKLNIDRDNYYNIDIVDNMNDPENKYSGDPSNLGAAMSEAYADFLSIEKKPDVYDMAKNGMSLAKQMVRENQVAGVELDANGNITTTATRDFTLDDSKALIKTMIHNPEVSQGMYRELRDLHEANPEAYEQYYDDSTKQYNYADYAVDTYADMFVVKEKKSTKKGGGDGQGGDGINYDDFDFTHSSFTYNVDPLNQEPIIDKDGNVIDSMDLRTISLKPAGKSKSVIPLEVDIEGVGSVKFTLSKIQENSGGEWEVVGSYLDPKSKRRKTVNLPYGAQGNNVKDAIYLNYGKFTVEQYLRDQESGGEFDNVGSGDFDNIGQE